jgi:hypothetical protein
VGIDFRIADLERRVGDTADPAAAGDGSVIALLKSIRDAPGGGGAGGDIGESTDPEAAGDGSLIAITKRVRTNVANIGAPTDAEAPADGSAIAVLKRIRTLAANIVGIGAATDPEAAGDGSLIAVLKRIRTLLANVAHIGTATDAEAAGDGSLIAVAKRLRTLLGNLLGNLPTVHVTGTAAALAANAVLADAGQLAAGTYEVSVHAASTATAGVGQYLLIEHRNAANGATLHQHVIPSPGQGRWHVPKLVVALNERVRVVGGPTAGTASSRQVADVYVRVAP